MTIQADTRLAGWALTTLGLVLVATSFAAALSLIGLILFYAGAITAPLGIFLLRVGPSTSLLGALIETVGIVVALIMLSGLLWWSAATVIGGE